MQRIGTQSWAQTQGHACIYTGSAITYVLSHTHAHTLVNIELLHESEDLFGEFFGLDLLRAMFGQREEIETPEETQAETQLQTGAAFRQHSTEVGKWIHVPNLYKFPVILSQ